MTLDVRPSTTVDLQVRQRAGIELAFDFAWSATGDLLDPRQLVLATRGSIDLLWIAGGAREYLVDVDRLRRAARFWQLPQARRQALEEVRTERRNPFLLASATYGSHLLALTFVAQGPIAAGSPLTASHGVARLVGKWVGIRDRLLARASKTVEADLQIAALRLVRDELTEADRTIPTLAPLRESTAEAVTQAAQALVNATGARVVE